MAQRNAPTRFGRGDAIDAVVGTSDTNPSQHRDLNLVERVALSHVTLRLEMPLIEATLGVTGQSVPPNCPRLLSNLDGVPDEGLVPSLP